LDEDKAAKRLRAEAFEVQTPQFPKTSFFAQQSAEERAQ
jgi:hypothetical protein